LDEESQTGLRARSRQFAALTALLGLALVAGILLSFGAALLGPPQDVAARAILYVLYWFPALFYLWGLAAIRRAFIDMARGALFGPAVARGLRHLGWALLLGGTAAAAVLHVLQSASLPGGFADGTVKPFAGTGFDPAHLMLVLVGAALLLLARLLRIADDYRQRSRKLEAELEEYV
jgi:hypothetical protein